MSWWWRIALFVFVMCIPQSANAVELSGRVEPFGAIPISSPQTERFWPGGGATLGGSIGIVPYFEWQAEATFLELTPGRLTWPDGKAFTIGTGPRIERPRSLGFSPWIEADGLFVNTGALDRFGLSFAAGVTFPFPHVEHLSIGPFVRALVIMQPGTPGYNDGDARILMGGLTIEWSAGSSAREKPRDEEEERKLALRGADKDGDGLLDRIDRCPDLPGPATNDGCPATPATSDRDRDGVSDLEDRCPDAPGPPELHGCPDRDRDGVPDTDDECPGVQGPPENRGCPVYRLVTIFGDKVELGEKIFFAFGTTTILPASLPLLDEAARAMKEREMLRIRIEGHTDSVGEATSNMSLSQQRVEVVKQFLIGEGIDPSRITVASFGATLPIDTNDTPEGRERNRRVEIKVTAGELPGGTKVAPAADSKRPEPAPATAPKKEAAPHPAAKPAPETHPKKGDAPPAGPKRSTAPDKKDHGVKGDKHTAEGGTR